MCNSLSQLEFSYRTRNSVRYTLFIVIRSVLIAFRASFVLAATEHLHNQIAKLSARIRTLEDALAFLQAKHSTEPHPLLRDDWLGVNTEGDDEPAIADEIGTPVNNSDIINSFGTLSILDNGTSRFFGPTGGSEVCDLYLPNLHPFNFFCRVYLWYARLNIASMSSHKFISGKRCQTLPISTPTRRRKRI